MTTATYSIQMTDSEQTPAWMSLCTTAAPGNQDSGRVRYTVTTEQPEALEDALDADDAVISYEESEEPSDDTRSCILRERGNGLPDVGDYVAGDDGEVYTVTAIDNHIHTGRHGSGNYCHGRVRIASWSDVTDDTEPVAAAEFGR